MISQTEHKLTGFPHIDKMWMENYDISLIENKLPAKTIYQYMKEKSLPAKYNTAITYYGKKFLIMNCIIRLNYLVKYFLN